MKRKRIFTGCIALLAFNAFSHEQLVHEAITVNAAASALNNSPAFKTFFNVMSPDRSLTQETNLMVLGGHHEDYVDQPLDLGGKRSYNHFYDPLDTTYGKGLSDIPIFGRGGSVGNNSFVWGSTLNCPGINFSGVSWIGRNVDTMNAYSWKNARNYELLGLTVSDQLTRQANLDAMFRSVGQVMHLLEDTTSPQHVRNEQHLPPFWKSPIESWGLANRLLLYYGDGSMLDWRGIGFTKLEDFWDRQLYAPGNSAALVADAAENPNGGTHTLGLAEWCNGNFLGARHLYPEYFQPGDISYYPYPSRTTSTDYAQKVANPPSGIKALNLKNGYQGQAIYVNKTGDGITYPNISRFTYFAAKLSYGMMTINDPNVLSSYHNQFIPKAVKYSAGLLDYFFRGTLDVKVVGQSSLRIKNRSGQDFKDGSFRLFYDDAHGNRAEITDFSTTYNGALSSGGSINGSFTAPVGASKYILVYQGTIGTTGGQASDPVDAGIAIATQSFSPPISVQISLYGSVMDYLGWSVNALLKDENNNQLSSLTIYDTQYGDGTGCDTRPTTKRTIALECGNTYNLSLSGEACSATVGFTSLPGGYFLEFQDSSGVVDNRNSQTIHGITSKSWKMTLNPKRILFTKDSIPPDGVDQTQAKLTFLTGSSGGLFTGNPQWSITGDALGCTIDPNTGWIRAGTETGEITVQARDSNSPYNYLRAALKIGSGGSSGIGAGVLANVGNALAVSLGVLPCDGSFMGSIRLKLTNPSPSLATPAGLTYDQYNTDNALPEILNETLGNTATPVRQVLAPQGLADIVTISGTEYEIRLYLPEDAGTKANGYYAPTGTPFKVWRVASSATDGGGNVTAFIITEDPDGANIANTFTWNAGNNSWTLNGNY